MTDDLSRDIEAIAGEIPAAPRGLAELRQILGTMPPASPLSLPGVVPNELPATEEQAQELAAGTAGVSGTTTGGSLATPAASIPGSAMVPGTMAGSVLIDHTLDFPKFAAGIVPPRVSATAPTLPSADYPVGSFYFNSTDKHLYKTTDGTTWGLAVDAGDIVANSITAGQIAAGAIGADEIAANAVRADKLLVGGAVGVAITNPGFENGDLTGWQEYDPNSCGSVAVEAVATSGLKVGTGTYQCSIQRSSAGAGEGPSVLSASDNAIAVKPGDRVFVSALVGGSGARFWVHYYDKDLGYLSSDQGPTFTPANARHSYRTTAVAPASAAYARVAIENSYTGSYPSWTVVDDIRVQAGDASIMAGVGNVFIDQDGITITNGRLTFQDEFGSTVVSGSGFSRAWTDFIRYGMYNAVLAQGANVDPLPVGRTTDLPYWTVAKTGTPGIKTAANTACPGGRRVEIAPSALTDTVTLTSDLIEVSSGSWANALTVWADADITAGSIKWTADVKYYAQDGTTLLFTDTAVLDVTELGGGSMTDRTATTLWVSSETPRYAKVVITFQEQTTHDSANRGYFAGAAIVPMVSSDFVYDLDASKLWGTAGADVYQSVQPASGTTEVFQTFTANPSVPASDERTFAIQADGKMIWGAGEPSAPDLELYRGAANQLYTPDDLRVGAVIIAKSIAGAPTDSDFAGSALNGGMALDNSNSRWYVRAGGSWKYAALTSDGRLKEVLGAVDGALERLKRLRPVRYRWRVPEAHGWGIRDREAERIGFVAQDLLESEPLWVDENGVNEEEFDLVGGKTGYAIDPQGQDVALLTAAVQELLARVEELEARVK